MNNNNFSSLKSALLVAGIVSVTGLITFPEAAFAKSKSQIAQLAIPVTVQINSLAGGGSGVIINQKKEQNGTVYTVLTANHVVENAAVKYQVKTHTGNTYQVESVEHYLRNQKKDPDLAVITFKTTDIYPIAKLGDSTQASFGASIAIFGYPYLDDNQKSDERPFVYSPGELNNPQGKRPNGYDWLYNAVTQKGMSGGPVFDENGNVVAVHGRGEKFGDKAAFNAGIPINTFIALEPGVRNSQAIAMNMTTNNSRNESGTTTSTPLESAYNKTDRYAGASHFFCDVTGETPKTMARNVVNGHEVTLIEWKDNPNFKWSIDKKERCQIVSGRFQRAYYENKLEFLKPGSSGGSPVICALENPEDDCSNQDVLITFSPGINANEWLTSFLQGNTGTVRGANQGVKDMTMMLSTLADE